MEDKKEFTEEELKQMKDDKHRRFASGLISSKNPSITTQSGNFTMSQIMTALSNPYTSVTTLQQLSLFFYCNNGIYYRLIEEMGNIPLYDLFLTPSLIPGASKKINADKLEKEYEAVASYLELLNYKYNCKWIGKSLITLGEIYLFVIEDNKGTIIKSIPHDLCRVSGVIDNNLFKYSMNISKLSNKDLYSTMPVEIQRLYDQYEAGTLDEEKLDQGYYPIEDPHAIALIFDDANVRSKAIPPFAYLFDKLFRVNELEDDDIASSQSDNIKILHQKFNIDDEGNPEIEEDVLNAYHTSTKAVLPKKIGITTSPLDLQMLTTNRTDNQTLSASMKLYEQISIASGVNSELFSGKRNSNESVLNSIRTDEMLVHRLTLIMQNFINYFINNKKKNSLWKATMIGNTYFNREEIIKRERENAVVGLGKMKFLGANGYTPLSAKAQLVYETMIDINQYFKPLASGYNSSSVGDDNGRPANKDSNNTDKNTPEAE